MNISSLEASREYVLHGPLLATYWARLCPRSGERASRSCASPEDAVYSLIGSGSSVTQHFLLSGWLLNSVQVNITLKCTIHPRIHLWYMIQSIHFIYITLMHSIYTFFFTFLLIFSEGWLPLTLDVRYKSKRFSRASRQSLKSIEKETPCKFNGSCSDGIQYTSGIFTKYLVSSTLGPVAKGLLDLQYTVNLSKLIWLIKVDFGAWAGPKCLCFSKCMKN